MLFAPTLLLLVPLLYLVGALLPERLFTNATDRRWTVSLLIATAAPLLALVAAAAVAAGHSAVGSLSLGEALGAWAPSVQLDALTAVMLLLVTSIAGVILRFSQRYLDGEPGRPPYVRWFMATMSGVSLLVVSNDLLVLALAWTATSVTLHQLLTFYGERTAALVAAHKKFLVSRAADVAIFSAVALIWWTMRTLRIDELLERAGTLREIPSALEGAGLLLAIGVILRTAQLPFHGWLIQVMEAPTPVSAFLHAGIVNIGGFVLIRLSGLTGRLEGAQILLVIVGTVTAVLAALVTTTRISIKVSLAWSTCAQMGFMLLECGLGAYGLALLHVVAHSLYKAHAFLASGRAVEQQLRRRMVPMAPVSVGPWIRGSVGAALVVSALGFATAFVPALNIEGDVGTIAAALILTLALAPLFVRGATGDRGAALRGLGVAVGLIATYAAGHALFSAIAPTVSGTPLLNALRFAVVATAFLALFVVQSAIAIDTAGRVARAFHPACFAGFYLDELCTRWTFQLWPPRAQPAPTEIIPSPIPASREIPT